MNQVADMYGIAKDICSRGEQNRDSNKLPDDGQLRPKHVGVLKKKLVFNQSDCFKVFKSFKVLKT